MKAASRRKKSLRVHLPTVNLWTKAITEVSYDDVQAFCAENLPEGTRLDYKAEFAKELEKLLCAFANPYGGLILVGVDSDKNTDTPLWPPKGISLVPGLELTVQQKAADAVYPPVPVQVSRPLPIPGKSDRVLLVIRIDPSPEAPHAIEKNRKVYERTGNRNQPNELADLVEFNSFWIAVGSSVSDACSSCNKSLSGHAGRSKEIRKCHNAGCQSHHSIPAVHCASWSIAGKRIAKAKSSPLAFHSGRREVLSLSARASPRTAAVAIGGIPARRSGDTSSA